MIDNVPLNLPGKMPQRQHLSRLPHSTVPGSILTLLSCRQEEPTFKGLQKARKVEVFWILQGKRKFHKVRAATEKVCFLSPL